MAHYCAKPFEQVWNSTAFPLSLFSIHSVIKMLWKKESARAGLGGFTPREAVGGEAFQLNYIQNRDDPLADPDLAVYGDVVKEVSIISFKLEFLAIVHLCRMC